jgi:hypothetical protein
VTTWRNVAIVLAIAAAVTFLPGGGDVADVISRTLSLAFIAVLAWAGWWAYRHFSFDLDALPGGFRALLYCAVATVLFVIAGWDELTSTTSGSLVFIALLAAAAVALVAVWRAHRDVT